MSNPVLFTPGMRRGRQGSSKPNPPSWAMHHSSVQSPYEDDCEEYVPLSPSNSPSNRHTASFSEMLQDSWHSPPIIAKKEPSSQTQAMHESHGPEVSVSSPLHGSPGMEVSPTQEKGSQPPKGTKRQRASTVQWDDRSTHTLLRVYEETWTHIKKGNFRAKDWEDLTFALNKEIDGSFNSEHARNRIDTLKKTHKKELNKQNSSGSTPSTWPLFEMCDDLWGRTPKATGIACAFDSDGRRTSQSSTPIAESPADVPAPEGGASSQNPPPDTAAAAASTEIDIDGVYGKKVKQSSRSSLQAFSRTMGDGLKGICSTYTQAEEKKGAILRELEQSRLAHEEKRMAHEERLHRIAQEEETKRQEMFLATQLEIAKLIAKKND